MTVGQITGADEPAQQPAWSAVESGVGRTADMVVLYRAALQRLIGRRDFGRFEVLLLWSVSDAIATLRRHGIGDNSLCVTLAARHVLEQMELRREPSQPFRVLADEGNALDDLLRVHEQQLGSHRLAAVLPTREIGKRGQRGARRGGDPDGGRLRASVKGQLGTALHG